MITVTGDIVAGYEPPIGDVTGHINATDPALRIKILLSSAPAPTLMARAVKVRASILLSASPAPTLLARRMLPARAQILLSSAPAPSLTAKRVTKANAWLPSPAGTPSLLGWIDWPDAINQNLDRQFYICELRKTGLDSVRVPMIYLQATLNSRRSNFLSVVLPSDDSFIPLITERLGGTFAVIRGVLKSGGTVREVEMFEAPISLPGRSIGPTSSSIPLSGYTPAYVPTGALAGITRRLQHIRTITTGVETRIRCAVDWWLKPGMIADTGTFTFEVGYINYYVTDNDAYCDIGAAPING